MISLTHRAAARLLLALLPLGGVPALATTIVMPTDRQLEEKSPVVVIAHVASSQAVERGGGIWTETRLDVERSIRGGAHGTLIVREVGGIVGERVNVVFGSPEYRAGERVLAFLAPTPRGDYQTVDLFVGKFTERETVDGRRIWFRDDSMTGTRVLDPDFSERIVTNVQRDADGFETYLEAHGAGSLAVPRYWIEKPQFARKFGDDFTLIDEPNLYRWFTFDDGGTVTWRHTGTQSGYSNGGAGELQIGLNAWSGYSGAKIRYSYGGASSSAPGGLELPNGISEVMFGDPKNEIQGSWNGNSGVVGRGGFNSLKGFRSWTSTFSADGSHPARSYSGVGDIAEGNLVIQDGVTPAKGISSAVLAEILAHEFGHTLGFGHSADASALMYASVTSLGAGLRADDQLAARWLYPSSGGGPVAGAPSAPSNLVATGAGNTLQLSWTDNANNETVHTIHIGTSSNSLVPVQSAAANATSATVPNLVAGQLYFIRVSASNATGESPLSNLAQAVVPGAVLSAAFLASPTSGIAGITNFTFIDKSTGPVASRQWTLGDGSVSSDATVSHVYAAGGTFTVTLRVSDAQGKSSSTQKPVSVGSTAQSIAAAFTFSPTAPVAGDEVRFSDQSAGPVQQWLWNFGDGTTSTERNPTRRFSNPGAFEVALTVTNGAEISTATATVYVAVGSGVTPAVEASFEMSTLWPASGREIRFFDRSSGPPRSWSWDFGDGTGSTLPNPTHVFAKPGTYTVTLRAGNDASSSVQERTIIVDEDAQRRQALLPVAALTQGAGSSFWRTELTLANASSVAINVDFLFLSGATPLHKSDIIGAGESKVYENALRDLFRVSAGSGALIVEATAKGAQPDLRVSSRTFTTGSNGTYGQHVPSASTDPSTTLFIPGLEVSADFRTNLGLVNHGNVEARVNLELFDAEGRSVGKTTRTLAGGAFVQERLQTFFDLQEGSALLFRLQSETAHNVVAYASIIDNRTEDPIFVPAKQTSANAELIIPAVARAEGANRTFWRSDITLFNPTTVPMAVSLKLLDGARPEKALMIPRDTTMVIRDVMSWLGEEAVRGPLRITATGTALAPIVFSRTYTTQEGGGGTYGQWIDAIDRTRLRPVSYIVGLRSDESFRTNVGLINVGEGPATATISLLNSAGDVATVYETIPAGGAIQKDVRAFFPSAEGAFSLRLEGSGGLFAYGSVIDNLSGDPVYIAGD